MTLARRAILATLGLALAAGPAALAAQQAERIARVGWVSSGPAAGGSPRTVHLESFRAGLRERGWIEGRNLVLDVQIGERAQAAAFAKGLVERRAEVILATGPMFVGVRSQAGSTPIVFAMTGDPVEAKWVETLAHPGGTATGVSALALELEAKRLEILKELRPGLGRIAILANELHPGYRSQVRAAQEAAQRLGLTLHSVSVRIPGDFEAAFTTIVQSGAEAILTFPDALTEGQAKAIAAFAAKRRLPSMGGFASFVEEGNLIAYGPNEREFYSRAAHYVDRILRGAKPADLPVELPSRFELTVSERTAGTLGLAVPKSILLRADSLIR